MRTAPIVLLLLLVLAAPVAVAAPLISLSISAGDLERGQRYTVTLGITGADGWLDVALDAPPGITILDVETSGDPELLDIRDATAQRHESRALVRAGEALTLNYTILVEANALPPVERVLVSVRSAEGAVALDAPARVLVGGGPIFRTLLPLVRR